MKLSRKKYNMNTPKNILRLIKEKKLLDEIFEKIKNNPDIKLTEDEIRIIKDNIEKFKKETIYSSKLNPEISEEIYEGIVINQLISNPILDSMDKLSAILSLKDLKRMQVKQKSQTGNNEFTAYEWKLLDLLNDEKIGLEEFEKEFLILTVRNIKFYTTCILSKDLGLSPEVKINLIRGYKDIEGVTIEKYASMVTILAKEQHISSEIKNISELILELREYKELTEEYVATERFGDISKYDKTVLNYLVNIYNKKIEISDYELLSLVKSITNIKIIDYLLEYDLIKPSQKAQVISNTDNVDYILKCIENKELYLGDSGRTDLILTLETEKIKEYVLRGDLLDSEDKVTLILSLKDEEYTKECLESTELNISPVQKVIAIVEGITDKKYLNRCLTEDFLNLDIRSKDYLINQVGSEKEKTKWNNQILQIKDISCITIEELEKTEKAIIRTEDENVSLYSKDEYIEIKKKMNEILQGVEKPVHGNKESELKAFLEICKRIANHISYDEFAISEEGEKDYNLQRECRNLYGGLVNGKSVCAGYANILKNALACVGIESQYIKGFNLQNGEGHAWNQVKIGDEWYNVDLTWERNEIVRTGEVSVGILKSDKEFENHNKYSEKRTKSEKVCGFSAKENLGLNGIIKQSKKQNLENDDI